MVCQVEVGRAGRGEKAVWSYLLGTGGGWRGEEEGGVAMVVYRFFADGIYS
jgi:hypothetical protein